MGRRGGDSRTELQIVLSALEGLVLEALDDDLQLGHLQSRALMRHVVVVERRLLDVVGIELPDSAPPDGAKSPPRNTPVLRLYRRRFCGLSAETASVSVMY
jgi:hypothetical protein